MVVLIMMDVTKQMEDVLGKLDGLKVNVALVGVGYMDQTVNQHVVLAAQEEHV